MRSGQEGRQALTKDTGVGLDGGFLSLDDLTLIGKIKRDVFSAVSQPMERCHGLP